MLSEGRCQSLQHLPTPEVPGWRLESGNTKTKQNVNLPSSFFLRQKTNKRNTKLHIFILLLKLQLLSIKKAFGKKKKTVSGCDVLFCYEAKNTFTTQLHWLGTWDLCSNAPARSIQLLQCGCGSVWGSLSGPPRFSHIWIPITHRQQ